MWIVLVSVQSEATFFLATHSVLQGGQIRLMEHQIPERKSHAFSWNLSYTILPWKGGMWDVGWDEMELFNLWKRQNDAGFFMHVNLSLKMLFLMHLFTLVFGFDGGVSIACDCRYRSLYRWLIRGRSCWLYRLVCCCQHPLNFGIPF